VSEQALVVSPRHQNLVQAIKPIKYFFEKTPQVKAHFHGTALHLLAKLQNYLQNQGYPRHTHFT
jgi:hypothetical protein